MANTGPLGQRRGVGFGILIYIVTFGIYGLYWIYKTHDEVKAHSGEGVGGGLGLVIALLTGGLANFFMIPSEVGKMHAADGQTPPVSGKTGFWILLPLLGGIVWFVKIQGALNRYWQSKQAAAPAAPAAEPTA